MNQALLPQIYLILMVAGGVSLLLILSIGLWRLRVKAAAQRELIQRLRRIRQEEADKYSGKR